MKTTINWRPYPEQKPRDPGHYMTRTLFEGAEYLRVFRWNRQRWDSLVITHFALPSDITTEEA